MSSFGHSYDEFISNFTGWMLALIGAVGLVLNSVLFVILNWHGNRGLSLQLVVLISVMDIFSCLSAIFLAVARVIWGAPEMFDVSGFCSGVGFTSLLSVGMSGMLLASLGLERYLAICNQRHVPMRGLVVVLSAAFVGQTCLLGTAVFEDGLVRDATFSHCVLSNAQGLQIHYWLLNIVFLSPILVLTFCYTAIFVKCLSADQPNEHFSSRRLSLRALLFLAVYHVCFCPKFIFSLWGIFGSRTRRPISLHILGTLGVALSVTINPILVLYLNKDIRTTAFIHLRRHKPFPYP
ncbi:hypothetical protein DSO57_1013420 [Entomophthora muscae]|uniref:Uncharacterized protein n=1 Tax=Entomophthora muscae TaxID=34485 RepID=A0ACC2TTC5_9FUNG|nr:hypothetical protein DSO57_1013420 [Entomophthora muscae]